jgi:predicted NBD/HSP70 family sugar kinase
MSHIIGQIQKVLQILANEVGEEPARIGIGTPGSTDPKTGLLKGSNTQAINHQPLLDELRKALGIPVAMANDANCFALAEAQMGAVKEHLPTARVVFGVILGTGVGGGVVLDGHVLQGRHGIAGEWGHTFLDASGGPCYCGDVGCVERILAGPSLERFYEEISGESRPLPDIYQSYETGNDEFATKTIERLIQFFGLGLSNVINILDPDVIVLGGGLSNLDVLYDEGARSVRRHVFNPTFDTPILRPSLGDSAGVFGAALLSS